MERLSNLFRSLLPIGLFCGLVATSSGFAGNSPAPESARSPRSVRASKHLIQTAPSSPNPFSMSVIANAVRDMDRNPKEAVAKASEALLAAGFAIWDEDRKPLKAPTGAANGLAVTPGEIQTFVELRAQGEGGKMKDVLAAIDYIWKQAGGEESIGDEVREWLRFGAVDPDPTKRGIVALITELAAGHENARDVFWDDDAHMDALQTFLLMRVVTEDIGAPMREKLKKTAAPFAFDSVYPQTPMLEGWSEDGYVGAVGLTVDLMLSKLESVSAALSKANFVAAFAKFLATYKFLKLEFEVEAPGQPLVRTKDQDAGERRTLVTKVFIDGKAISDWLKENRVLIATVVPGLDLDAPKSGPLAGVETAWDFDQSRKYATKQLIQTVGQQDISKVVTDAEGKARIVVEGKPQRVKLDPKSVKPVEKTVRVFVTSQVKSTSMQQDMVDAVMGAAGFKDGPGLGIVTPILETLYRVKWLGQRIFKLQIRDWVPAETIAQLVIEVRGEGQENRRDSSTFARLDQTLEVRDFPMESSGGADMELPEIPASLLSQMSAKDRQEYLKAYEQMKANSKNETFYQKGPGPVRLTVKGSTTVRGTYVDCEEETVEDKVVFAGEDAWQHPTERSENRLLDWNVVVNRTEGTATVRVSASCKGFNHVTRRSSKPANNKDERSESPAFLGAGFEMEGELKVPLKVEENKEAGTVDYRGTGSIPFKFGPRKQFTGSILVSFSLTKKAKKK